MMKFTAQQIATLVQGSIEGDSQRSVHAFAKIEDGKEGDLCFLANPRYEHFIYSTRAGIVLVSESLTLKQPVTSTLIRVKDAYAAFATLLQTYQDLTTVRPQPGKEMHSHVAASASIDESAYIGSFVYVSEGAQVGKQSYIHPNCYVGANVKIGDRVILYPGVTIYHNCIIGNDCIIHSGTVIGSDGFGFAPENGHFRKIPQLGNVVIEDMVEIGANCSIDRATMGSTRIRKGA
ncbi:MAG TPA: UDP-3-O-(3-hydroxymyristoyl)glucosamine N-acyltransferase, partial [Chitinophagaceae bacterium]|nr:UDP-3-O-(3-hydroxymyristoyl)glucosamine N-acyltransferase [Chitinophagaceae bacterium]